MHVGGGGGGVPCSITNKMIADDNDTGRAACVFLLPGTATVQESCKFNMVSCLHIRHC